VSGLRRVALVLLLALVTPACAVNGLSFFQDYQLDIIQPDENAEVSLPLTVRWEADKRDGYFAVFLDRSPLRPGKPLLSLVPSDDPCLKQEVCPDSAWLAEHNVYVTDKNEIAVELLVDKRENNRSKDRHDMTIVLLDPTGRRVGETVFYREFIVERGDA